MHGTRTVDPSIVTTTGIALVLSPLQVIIWSPCCWLGFVGDWMPSRSGCQLTVSVHRLVESRCYGPTVGSLSTKGVLKATSMSTGTNLRALVGVWSSYSDQDIDILIKTLLF